MGASSSKKEEAKSPSKKKGHSIKNIKKIINEYKGFIFWIDKDINNFENSYYLELIQKDPFKQLLSSLKLICFEYLEEAFDVIVNYMNFKVIFIIISGSLYCDYYDYLKVFKKIIKCLPICVIFTSDRFKKILKERKERPIYYYIKNEILDSIENPFYNLGGVNSKFLPCIGFISNFWNALQKDISKLQKGNISYEGCITFERIYSKNQLILPFILNELLSEEKVSDNEVLSFNEFLLKNYKEREIRDLIHPMVKIKEIPHEIIAKYFLRAYTEETSFYKEMNNLLMKQKGEDYQIYIKLLFEEVLNDSLIVSKDDNLYRGSAMSRKEIDEIIELFNQWENERDKNEDKTLPLFLLYSRCFLSFTKDQKQINKFLGKTDSIKYACIFELENKDYRTNLTYSSNADIESISNFENEKEVVFFPFSTFCLKAIRKEKNFENNNEEYIKINLEYLGKYDNHIFNEIQKDKNLKNTFINTFNNQNYSNELIKSNLLYSKKCDLKEPKKQIFQKIKNKMKEKFNIELTEESAEKNNYNEKMVFYEFREKINEIKKKESLDIEIDKNLLKEIQERNKKKESENEYYFTSLKLEEMEYIWKGDYNSVDDNLVFEGEYEMV